MVYIHTNQGASLAQNVPKRSLEIQRICQETEKTKADISRSPNKATSSTATADNPLRRKCPHQKLCHDCVNWFLLATCPEDNAKLK